MKHIVLYFFLAGIISLSACTKDEPSHSTVKVLSTIKPIQAIVSAIGGKYVDSHKLIPDFGSPHTYVFKPSAMKKISDADIIFRIDDHFEVMLNPAFSNVLDQTKIVSFADYPTMHLLPLSSKHIHDIHDDKGDKHNAIDMHLFTSPQNAIAIAQIIADKLSNIDPDNSNNYTANLQNFKNEVLKVSNAIKLQLEPYKDVPYVVFHDSWQYFRDYFGLQKPKIIHFQEGVAAGIKTIKDTRKEISSQNIYCIFSDLNTSPKRVTALNEGLSIKNVVIDVLASHIPINQNTYTNWLESMGYQVKSCLEN